MTEPKSKQTHVRELREKLLLKAGHMRDSKIRKGSEESTLNIICFSLFNEIYGVELEFLREILKIDAISRVPGSKECLKGIINLRGSLLTVYDLKKKLGLTSTQQQADTRILIVEFQERLIGLLVDRVMEIIHLSKGALLDPQAGFSHIETQYIKKIGKTADHVIIIPNLHAIFQTLSL